MREALCARQWSERTSPTVPEALGEGTAIEPVPSGGGAGQTGKAVSCADSALFPRVGENRI